MEKKDSVKNYTEFIKFSRSKANKRIASDWTQMSQQRETKSALDFFFRFV